MPFAIFDVRVDPNDLLDELKRKGKSVEHLAPAFSIVAEDFVAAVVDRIDSRGDGTWPPNAPATIAHKKGGDAPMIDTGQLRGSIRPDSGNDWAEASTSVKYVVYSLDGGPVIPQRNPFDFQEDVWEEAAQLIADAVAEA